MSTKEVVMTEEWNESDDFKRVGTEGLSGEDIGEKSLTYWADVWRRFRENKLAIFGLILLGLIVVLLFIGPMVTGQDYQLIDASIKCLCRWTYFNLYWFMLYIGNVCDRSTSWSAGRIKRRTGR